MQITIISELALRLVVASILGSLIGLEREFRSKEAGLRTHFLVTLGAALFMIISQWGFQTTSGVAGLRGADQARVAAQIVSGIGFLGAGTIIMQKHMIRGLTTAAGLWVAAAIGMAVGGGLYILAILAALLTLIGLEILGILFRRIKLISWNLVFTAPIDINLSGINESLRAQGLNIVEYSVEREQTDGTHPQFRISVQMRASPDYNVSRMMKITRNIENITVKLLDYHSH